MPEVGVDSVMYEILKFGLRIKDMEDENAS